MKMHPARPLVDRFGMDEDQANSVVACVAILLAVGICGLIWGGRIVDTVLIICVLFLVLDRAGLHARVDEAYDRADKAHGKADGLENHLIGQESPGRGKHAHSSSASPAPAPRRTHP